MLTRSIVEYCTHPDDSSFDADFCSRDFDAFFQASTTVIMFPGLKNSEDEPLATLTIEGTIGVDTARLLRQIHDRVRTSSEYKEAKPKDRPNVMAGLLCKVNVETMDEEKHVTTSGKLTDYLQLEFKDGESVYFRMDSKWYFLQPAFDEILIDKYTNRIGLGVKQHSFIKSWKASDEMEYNKEYDSKSNPLYLHMIKVDYIELCDALFVDKSENLSYIVHVKEGIGASIRDLTSQVFIAAESY